MARELRVEDLHQHPHTGYIKGNNRKLTKGRYIVATKVQNVPIYGTVLIDGTVLTKGDKFLGFKHIVHN